MASPTDATSARRIPLARTRDGEPFAVPAEAYSWRVKRFKNPGTRGAPEVVYGDDGAPLELPIDTAIADFREAVGGERGGYRLDAIDVDGLLLRQLPPAYLQIDGVTAPRNGGPTPASGTGDPMLEMMREMMQTTRELARTNAELATRVIERFPSMIDASAGLVRAADGAGLPQRPAHDARNASAAVAVDDDRDDDTDTEIDADGWPAAIKGIVDQLVPMVQMVIAHRMGGAKPRNASGAAPGEEPARPASNAPTEATAPGAPAATPNPAAQATTSAAAARRTATPAPATPRAPTPDQLAHFAAIQMALTPREGQIARALAAELPPEDMTAWLRELCALAVPDAVALIRRHLAQTAPAPSVKERDPAPGEPVDTRGPPAIDATR